MEFNRDQLVKLFEYCSKSKYCDGCSMMYNPRVLEARSFDPDFSCGKMLIRWAVSIIKSQEQKIFELENRLKECERCKLHDAEEKVKELERKCENLNKCNERLTVTLKMLDFPFPEGLQIVHDYCEKKKREAKADTVRKMLERIKEDAISVSLLSNPPKFMLEIREDALDQIAKEMV